MDTLRLSIIIIVGIVGCAGGRHQLVNGSFSTELNGFDIHYEVHGSGPVLMTVPNSWGLSLEGLRALYRPLEEHVTMVYFDPRGMGESGSARETSDLGPSAVREDFHALREHLGLERVHAIGWSNGASNLILLAAEKPETIDRAIFLHAVASFDEEDARSMVERYRDLYAEFDRFQREMDESELTPEEQAERVKAFDTEVWFPYLFADREAGKQKLPELYQDAEFSWAHSQATNQEWATLDVRDQLADITAQCLVISGRHDMLPPEKGDVIADGVHEGRHVVFEDSAHFAPVEEPEKFQELVLSFLGA